MVSHIPDFFDGYHLPKGEHICTIDDIKDRFVYNEIRERRWNNFINMLERMLELGLRPTSALINGSFVTGREEPGDVDFALLIPPEVVEKALENALDEHDRNGIYLFMNPKNQVALRDLFGAHLLIADSEENLRGWSILFQKGLYGKLREPDPIRDPSWVKRPESKGILRINFQWDNKLGGDASA
jgi:hypothetical protein